MNSVKVGFALCGSFCTLSKAVIQIEKLKELGAEIFPIMSPITYSIDTRFGTAKSFIDKIENLCDKKIIHEIWQAEPIGPKNLLDILIVAPCTGNTLGKLACGITDTSVTMAAKAHLRNNKPVLIAVSSNDALSTSAKNIGLLMNTKNIYFVPFSQDAPNSKCTSCVCDFNKIPEAARAALNEIQLQPVLL
ncbi:MAG: dipicolinate synthase subunit B [Clostridia bacterium]|nr:dipicolinate synthase subunit B [Clostridia bacterium]